MCNNKNYMIATIGIHIIRVKKIQGLSEIRSKRHLPILRITWANYLYKENKLEYIFNS